MKTAYCTLDPRYKKKGKLTEGTNNIKLYVNINGDRKYFRTALNTTVEHWEKINGKSTKDQSVINLKNDIREIETKANKVLDTLDDDASIEEFYEAYNENIQKSDESKLLSYWFDKYIVFLAATKHPHSTIETIRTSRNSFKEFKPQIKINQVSVEFLNKYSTWFEEKGNSVATMQNYLRNLRTVVNYAIEKKVISPTKYPFGNRGFTIGTTAARKTAMTKDKIHELINLDLKTGSDLEFSRDVYIFQYMCNGMNLIDMCRLKVKDVDSSGEYFSFTRKKTRKTASKTILIRVYIHPLVKKIMEKWGTNKTSPEDYVFPFLETPDGVERNSTSERNRKLFISKKINKNLKILSQMISVPYKITTGMARHTFATVLARANTALADIKDQMGHTNIRTTQGYIASTDDQRIKDNSSNLL